MTRLLAIVVLAIVVWLLLEWAYRKLMATAGLDHGTGRRRSSRGSPPTGGEPLVRCDACGSYVPGSRALDVGGGAAGRRACSPECRSRLRGGPS